MNRTGNIVKVFQRNSNEDKF